jgi:hypothetical protein
MLFLRLLLLLPLVCLPFLHSVALLLLTILHRPELGLVLLLYLLALFGLGGTARLLLLFGLELGALRVMTRLEVRALLRMPERQLLPRRSR